MSIFGTQLTISGADSHDPKVWSAVDLHVDHAVSWDLVRITVAEANDPWSEHQIVLTMDQAAKVAETLNRITEGKT